MIHQSSYSVYDDLIPFTFPTHIQPFNTFTLAPKPTMYFSSSNSEPNVSFAYVCLVDNMTPTNKSIMNCDSKHSRTSLHVIDNKYEEVGTSRDDDTTIQVQRSTAFHELIDCNRKLLAVENYAIGAMDSKMIFSSTHANNKSGAYIKEGDARILKLTRNKWLSESRDGSPDARQALLTPSGSDTSSNAEDLEESKAANKVMSTVLALDKEHNLFGLSHMKIEEPTELKRKDTGNKNRAVFHQTAIVNVCYKRCCGRRSKSDLPQSLKCGGSCGSCSRCGSCSTICSTCCGTSCVRLCGQPCARPCGTPCRTPCGKIGVPPRVPCMVPCKKTRIPKFCSTCSIYGCLPSVCKADCTKFGLQMTVHKLPEYEPTYTELEPKASSILHKPMAARSCHHTPHCQPPSSCFPYLMPCYWPARSGAPCSEPSRCFHNPPCPKRRAPKSKIDPGELCPVDHPCTGTAKGSGKCENLSCIGRNNEALKKALAEKYGTTK